MSLSPASRDRVSERLIQFVRKSLSWGNKENPFPGGTSFRYLIGMPAAEKFHIYDGLSISDPQISFLKRERGKVKKCFRAEGSVSACIHWCMQPQGINGLVTLQCCL